jgi:uncharacterized membrane protein
MTYGPAELIVLEFPGNKFNGEVIPAIRDLVDRGIVRIMDLVFVAKDVDGSTVAMELNDMDPTVVEALGGYVGEDKGLISDQDLEALAEHLAPNSSAGMILFEHMWTIRFREAVLGSGGRVVDDIRFPAEVVEEVAAAVLAAERSA